MSVETITLGTLSKQVLMVIANSENTSLNAALTRNVRWALHKAMRDWVSTVRPSDFRSFADISVVAGTTDYALDDTFMQMIDPGVAFTTSDYRTLQYITEQAFLEQRLGASQGRGEPYLYMLPQRSITTGAAQIRFWPTPSTTRTIRCYFLSLPGKLYDGNDYTVVDRRLNPSYHPHLVDGAIYELRRYLNVGGDWEPYRAAWMKAVEDARRNEPPVTGQTYQIGRYGGGPFRPSPQPVTSLGY